MILKLKGHKGCTGAAYKSLTEEVLGEGVEVRALTAPAEATLKMKDLNEIPEAEESSSRHCSALQQQCEVQVATAVVQLRKGPEGAATKSVKVGKLKMG